MSEENSKYEGPTLCLEIDVVEGGGYHWEIMMSAADASATKKLRYKASGKLNSLASAPGLFDIQVHDENRPVWTSMNKTDRKDLRKLMDSLLAEAISCLKGVKHL